MFFDGDNRYYHHPRRLDPADPTRMTMKENIDRLIVATMRKDMNDVCSILEHGVDVNMKGTSGRTCIMSASFKQRPLILQMFLSQEKVNLNVKDKLGHTALALACSTNNFEGVRQLLTCEHELDINKQDKQGATPLMVAVQKSELETIQMLLEHKADPCIPDKNGVTPLIRSATGNTAEVMLTLLEGKADPNAQDNKGRTAAIWCCRSGTHRHLNILLDYGVDLSLVDKADQLTAFSQAVWKDQTKCAIAILDSPMCPSLLRSRQDDANGFVSTYWETARRRKNKTLQDKLLEKMKEEIFNILISKNKNMKLTSDLLDLIAWYSV